MLRKHSPIDARVAASPKVTRRGFVKATSVSALAFVGLGISDAHVDKDILLRPPGAQDEMSLKARCNRCGRCISVCHTEAIGVASIAQGVGNTRTPIMRFNIGSCDFCGDCADVCPTSAIERFDVESAQAGNVSAVRIGIAELDTSLCLAWTSDSCNLCYTECPYEAVELDARNHPVVVADQCNGCGVCENICPILSLKSYIGGHRRAIEVKPIASLGEKTSGVEK